MSKSAILGDLHLGVRGGDINFLEFQIAWLKYFCEQCKALGITQVYQVGDFFDVRKNTDNRVVHKLLHEIIPMFREAGLKMTVLVGNHDIFYRDSNEISTPMLFLHTFAPDVFEVHDRLATVGDFLLMPWLDRRNMEELADVLRHTKAKYALGHLEMEGFPMYKGSVAEHGLEHGIFKQFKHVWTGHYHTVSSQSNMTYVGSPYHLTWSDVVDGVKRGFWVFDSETGKAELVENDEAMTLFAVMEYDPAADYKEGSLDAYKGNILKVIVKEKKNERHFKKFMGVLTSLSLINYNIIDQTITVQAEEITVDEKTLQLDTLSVMNQVIDQTDTIADPVAVKALASEIYIEAISNV